jgi:hypothetical protein
LGQACAGAWARARLWRPGRRGGELRLGAGAVEAGGGPRRARELVARQLAAGGAMRAAGGTGRAARGRRRAAARLGARGSGSA